MTICEFCMYASDECYLLDEPIEYDSSGMTVKANCPLRKNYGNLQVSDDGREVVHGESEQD